MRSRSRCAESGFTLLEVLIATVIMGIAVVGLLSSLSTSMRNAARLTDYDRAVLLSRQKMDELLLDKTIFAPAAVGGTWDPGVTGGEALTWRAAVTAFDLSEHPSPGQPMLERIHLTIQWSRGDQPRVFELDGYRRNVLPPQVGP